MVKDINVVVQDVLVLVGVLVTEVMDVMRTKVVRKDVQLVQGCYVRQP